MKTIINNADRKETKKMIVTYAIALIVLFAIFALTMYSDVPKFHR